jgi:hypothetical protein
MSDLDKAFEALQAKRRAADAARREAHERARAFVMAFFEQDLRPSRALADNGIECALSDGHVLLRRPAASVYDDAFVIVVGEHGEVDAGGRSLGRYDPTAAERMKQDLIAEIIARFDL